MPVSYNPETETAYTLSEAGSWEEAKVAKNDQTGQLYALEGNEWVEFSAPEPVIEPVQVPEIQAPETLKQRVQDVYGFEEDIERPAVLPIPGYKGQEGITAPEWLPALARAVELPGHVARGGEVRPRDVAEMALGVAIPALRGVSGTITKQIPARFTRAMIKEAPTAEQLRVQSTNLFDKATGSGAVVSDEGVFDMLSGLQDEMLKKGFDPDAHPESMTALKVLSKRIGFDADFAELQQMREFAGEAAGSLKPRDARIGRIMVEYIDNHIDNLTSSDLLAGATGDATKAASDLSKARALWGRTRRRQLIDTAFENAKSAGSGFENGLRSEFRSILKRINSGKLKGFAQAEKEAMEDVVRGDFSTNTLKKIGKLGSGLGQQSNVVGGSIGIGGGALLGGPVGAMAVPLAGTGAQKLAERGTRAAAEKARAMVSGDAPKALGVPRGAQGIPRSILGVGAATALPEVGELPDTEYYQRVLRGEEFF